VPRPSAVDPALSAFDAIVARGAALNPQERFADARNMGDELSRLTTPASMAEVSAWLQRVASEPLELRGRILAELESDASPTEVRAAIREQVGRDAPRQLETVSLDGEASISVSTWSDPSIDVAALMDDDVSGDAFSDATAREGSHGDASGSLDPARTASEEPTSVEPSSRRLDGMPAPAESLSEHETAVMLADRPASWGAEPPDLDEEPSWRPSAVPVPSEPLASTARAPIAILAVAAAAGLLRVGVVVAVGADDGESDAPPKPASSAAAVEVAGSAAPPREPSATLASESSPAMTNDVALEASSDVSSSAEAGSAPTPRRRRSRAKPKPSSGSDPFDALGGRH
jgi:hypothetical protein